MDVVERTTVASERRDPDSSVRRGFVPAGVAALVIAILTTITLLASGGGQRSPSPAATSKPDAQNRNGSSAASPAATDPRDAAAVAGKGGTSAGAPTDGSSASATPAPFATSFDVAARFASACVRPGGSQTITITTIPEAAVAYHAQYSDGKAGLDPGYYGGNDGGVAGDDGTWTDSWVVAANAPPGRVRVDVIAQMNEERGYTLLFFDVADASGRCG